MLIYCVGFKDSCIYLFLLSALTLFLIFSEEVLQLGFTVIVDMRGSTWNSIKPILKVLQEHFPAKINSVFIIKPENFWQKQRTNFGSNKFSFEVSVFFFQTSNFYLASGIIFMSSQVNLPRQTDREATISLQ